MIALCGLHHPQADRGAYAVDQLREFKANGAARNRQVGARFEWMRQDLLAVVGGNFYFGTPVPVRFRNTNVVAFTKDEQGRLLLETNMLSTSHDPRMAIQENFWVVRGNPIDLECPPHGRLVTADYANGDKLHVEFIPDMTAEAVAERYPDARVGDWNWAEMPQKLAAVEIQMKVGGTEVAFGARKTRLPGNNVMTNGFMAGCGVGLQFG